MDFQMKFWDNGKFSDIDFLPLEIRTANILKRAGIRSLLELREMGPARIKELPGMGDKSWRCLVAALDEFFKGQFDLSIPINPSVTIEDPALKWKLSDLAIKNISEIEEHQRNALINSTMFAVRLSTL